MPEERKQALREIGDFLGGTEDPEVVLRELEQISRQMTDSSSDPSPKIHTGLPKDVTAWFLKYVGADDTLICNEVGCKPEEIPFLLVQFEQRYNQHIF